ncbi:MAG: hypothetical protein J6B77_06130, partial [Clostridia bacterium]|nr:hypothetical protein [Clostridia bacterium]
MKKTKTDIRPYTRQFYRGNRGRFLLALCEIVLGAIGALLISWLLQQILDLIGGYDTGFTLTELTAISLLLVLGIAAAYLIGYHS